MWKHLWRHKKCVGNVLPIVRLDPGLALILLLAAFRFSISSSSSFEEGDQCDQRSELKVTLICQYCPKSNQSIFSKNVIYYKIAQIVSRYLGYFDNKICCQQLWKIAQSGHTEVDDDDETKNFWSRAKILFHCER